MSKCDCGSKKYSYKTVKSNKDKMKFDLCFRCGRFSGKADEDIVKKVVDDPYLLLEMIGNGFLIPN
jgi:3'-phosphoadenosine 5'-phosphosulfate sulfotransferase